MLLEGGSNNKCEKCGKNSSVIINNSCHSCYLNKKNIEETIKEYVSKINYQGSNIHIKSNLNAVISYIVRRLLDKSDLHPGVRDLDLLCLIDINDITIRYIDFYENIVSLLDNYLDSLDKTAEMTLLFCRNYVLEIVNFSLSGSYKRHIKINELLND